MIKPNERVLGRLAALKHDKDLTDWLEASLNEYRDIAVYQLDETGLRITQGKAQILAEMLAHVNRAAETIDKLRRA